MSTAERIEKLRQRKAELEELAKLESDVGALERRMLAGPGYGLVDHVIELVCECFHVSRADLAGRCRLESIVKARQACYWICCEGLGLHQAAVARLFGRDHGTIAHGCKAIEDSKDTNLKFRKRMDALLDRLKQTYHEQQPTNQTH